MVPCPPSSGSLSEGALRPLRERSERNELSSWESPSLRRQVWRAQVHLYPARPLRTDFLPYALTDLSAFGLRRHHSGIGNRLGYAVASAAVLLMAPSPAFPDGS